VSNRILALSAALAALAAAPVLAQDVSYELVNNTDLTVIEFYSSPVSDPEWGDDILGSQVIGPGESGTVTMYDGAAYCEYDFQFILEDGSTVEGQGDICTTPQFVLE